MDNEKGARVLYLIVDERGKRKSVVVIDLEAHANVCEDIYDMLVVRSRKDEARDFLDEVEKHFSKSRGG